MKKLFNKDRYLEARAKGLRGIELAKELGYKSVQSLSLAKINHEKQEKATLLLDNIKGLQKLKKKRIVLKKLSKVYQPKAIKKAIEQVDGEIVNKSPIESNVTIQEDNKNDDIVSLLENFTRRLIDSIDIDALEEKDKLYAAASYIKTMTEFINNMAKLKSNK